MNAPRTGVVLERDGAQFRVATSEGEVRAVLRGKAKRGDEQVIVGDRVRLEADGQGELIGIEGSGQTCRCAECVRAGAGPGAT